MTRDERKAARNMGRARQLVEEHIEWYGYIPHPDKLKEAISAALDEADKPVEAAEVADLVRQIHKAYPRGHHICCDAADLIERLSRQLAAKSRETALECIRVASPYGGYGIGQSIRRRYNLDKEPGNG